MKIFIYIALGITHPWYDKLKENAQRRYLYEKEICNYTSAEILKLNADKHSPTSSTWSTKRRVRGDAYVSGS